MTSFLRKFQRLIETKSGDVVEPDYIWLLYAVCALSEDACGWGGWVIDALFRGSDDGSGTFPSSTGDEILPAADTLICPRCGQDLFGTEVKIRMEVSVSQTPPLIPNVDYEIAPIEYED